MKDLSAGDIVVIIDWKGTEKEKLIGKTVKISSIKHERHYPILGKVLNGPYRGQMICLLYSEVSYTKEEKYPDICEWE